MARDGRNIVLEEARLRAGRFEQPQRFGDGLVGLAFRHAQQYDERRLAARLSGRASRRVSAVQG